MVKINVKVETLKKDLEAVKKESYEKIPEFSVKQIDLLIEKKEEKIEQEKEIETTKKAPIAILIFGGIFVLIIIFAIFFILKGSKKPEISTPQAPITQRPTEATKTEETKIKESSKAATETIKEETETQIKETKKIESLIRSEKEVNITLKEVNLQNIKEALLEEKLKKQEAYTFKKINLIFLDEKISPSYFFQKIFDPKVENSVALKGFLDNFTSKYDVLIYYTPTKEYLVLIFEIKNQNVVKTFLDYWLKGNENNPNLNFIFLTDDPGKNLAKIQTKKIEDYDLISIPFEKQNYGVNFLLAKNYFIIYGNNVVLNFINDLIKKLP
jgi:hypothetical protein